MAVIIGVKQQVKTYQILQQQNNYSVINNNLSSNLLYLNIDDNAYSNATINFKNNYQIGYIDDKISIYNNNNLLTVDNNNIIFYKDTILNSNIKILNYLNTSNNTTYFSNNIELNLNNNINNNFKIKYNNSSIFQINKNKVEINIPNIYASNIYIEPNSTIYTNYIDSPNDKPVVIKNMSFAESLRIFTTNIIQNITLDNDILFKNIIDYMPASSNKITPFDNESWSKYMIENNIETLDPNFIKPNIKIVKYISDVVGGSNIIELYTKNIGSINSNLIYSINNKGYINISSNYNSNTPLNIKIKPLNSNILEYTNLNDLNRNFCMNSNGYINIGNLNYLPNQLNISKNDNIFRNNTDLIYLNISNLNLTSNTNNNDLILIDFINNNDICNLIFEFSNSLSGNNINFNIFITNLFIKNNIKNSTIYDNNLYYIKKDFNLNNIDPSDTSQIFEKNLYTNIYYPKDIFNIIGIPRINNTLKYHIYPKNLEIIPNYEDLNIHNKITFKQTINLINFDIFFEFYIYKTNYIYNYTGEYLPKECNFITGKKNNDIKFIISQNGNIGIGTNFSEIYKLYINENALINNIDCKNIDNYLTKNISFNKCILNNINKLNNVELITANTIISSNNTLSNIFNNNTIINSNLTILDNGGNVIINTKTIIGNNNNNYNNYTLTLNTNNGIVIKNDQINNNPNILILSTSDNSYPFIKLKNINRDCTIGINATNNFQIKALNKNNLETSIIQNYYNDNSIAILNNSFVIFKDNANNVKIYAGRNNNDDWYNYISTDGISTTKKTSFNIFGDFNVLTTDNIPEPIISTYTNIDNKLRIGIGTNNNNIYNNNEIDYGLLINLNTKFSSNINIENNIYLKGTILSISDSNLKTDIVKIDNALEKIGNINGYIYKRTDTGNIETGLIAQEVLHILPEVIKYDNNHYNISYGNMCGILVESIKELNNKINKLNERIDYLEKNK